MAPPVLSERAPDRSFTPMKTDCSINCAKNGPLLVKGSGVLIDIHSKARTEISGTTALCRCGASENKPYCDGAHAKTEFSDEKGPDRVPDERKDYVGQRVTIHDNRGICAHAGFCTERLSSVFRMHEEPWIDPDKASPEEVIETIKSCPSGALSYTIDGVEHRDFESEPMILIAPNGPYAVKGSIELTEVDWAQGASKARYDLCRCGQSKNKPFCDGAHWTTKFDQRQ